jgi:lipopolysaccharide export system protein LptA
MVYPALEAVTPPALVQTASDPVLALEVPSQDAALSSNAVPETSDSSPSSPETAASSLGDPLDVPQSSTQATVRFTVTPAPEVMASLQKPFTPSAQSSNFILDASASHPFPQKLVQKVGQQGKPPTLAPDLAPDPTPTLPVSPPASPIPTLPAAPSPSLPLPTNPPPKPSSFVELSADRQEYDAARRALTAVGNVLLNYRTAELKADRVQTLALQKRVFAEGNVTLTQGGQVLQGDRLEYLLDQERGIFFKPRGIINLPSAGSEVAAPTPGTAAVGSNPLGGIKDSLGQPITQAPTIRAQEGIQRLRFEADRIEFTGQTWTAVNIRITSDPFSPPELEVTADRAQLRRVSAKEDVVTLQRPRLVFDRRIAIPIPRSTVLLSRARTNPFGVDFGFDDRDRGGLFLGRQFTPISNRRFTLSLTPQFFLQRAIVSKGFDLLSPDLYGLTARVKSEISPKMNFGAYAVLRSVDFTDFANNVRAGLRLDRQIGNKNLAFEAAYRERVVNGSLGEQEIQNRTGFIFSSPTEQLGKTGIELNYRLAAELLTANSDRFGGIDLVSLGRFQGSASVQKAVDLWRGTTLPPTATEGLKYTPSPIQPYLRVIGGVTGVVSGYSNGDSQTSIIGKIRFEGQFGHFSRPYLDYTGFFVGFSQGAQFGDSPFLFDRVIDRQVLSAGFLQQVYGPVRLGFQTSVNLDTGEFFNTDVILDYSRRTYGLTLRYNPNLQVGSIVFRINSFNWSSNQDLLSSPEIGAVEAGVGQTNKPF